MTDLTRLKGSWVRWSGTGSHGESLCIWFGDDATGFQVEIPNAARHGEPPVNISLAHTVPRHEAAKPLYPKHKNTDLL